jgi:hypothetical protein
MKLDNAVALGKSAAWQVAQVRTSPDNRRQWFVMLRDKSSKSYVLADNSDKPIVTEDLNSLVELIKSLGLNDFTVFL